MRCTRNLKYWKENKKFLDALVHQNMGRLFRERNILYFSKDERALFALLKTPDVTVDLDIITSFVSIRLSLLFSWHSRGYDTSAETMAKKYIRMIQTPILQSDSFDTTDVMLNPL